MLHDVLSPLLFAWQANKHFHIYAGWFAYIAGLVQCYRGLMLVADSDRVVLSAADMTFSVSYSPIRPSTSVHEWISVLCACVGVLLVLLERVAIECSRQERKKGT